MAFGQKNIDLLKGIVEKIFMNYIECNFWWEHIVKFKESPNVQLLKLQQLCQPRKLGGVGFRNNTDEQGSFG